MPKTKPLRSLQYNNRVAVVSMALPPGFTALVYLMDTKSIMPHGDSGGSLYPAGHWHRAHMTTFTKQVNA